MSSKNKNSRENKNNNNDQVLPNIREIFNDRFFPIHEVKIRKISERFTLLKKRKIKYFEYSHHVKPITFYSPQTNVETLTSTKLIP
jgi:hypothetical protein